MKERINKLLNAERLTKAIKTPKNFITGEVFKYATMALLPGYFLSFYLAFNDYSAVSVVGYPVFTFYVVFWFLVYVNNYVYRRDKATLEHLLMVNKFDAIDLISSFQKDVPEDSQPSTIGTKPSKELIELMKRIFDFNESELAESFVSFKGNIIKWLAHLDLMQREKLYRFYLPK